MCIVPVPLLLLLLLLLFLLVCMKMRGVSVVCRSFLQLFSLCAASLLSNVRGKVCRAFKRSWQCWLDSRDNPPSTPLLPGGVCTQAKRGGNFFLICFSGLTACPFHVTTSWAWWAQWLMVLWLMAVIPLWRYVSQAGHPFSHMVDGYGPSLEVCLKATCPGHMPSRCLPPHAAEGTTSYLAAIRAAAAEVRQKNRAHAAARESGTRMPTPPVPKDERTRTRERLLALYEGGLVVNTPFVGAGTHLQPLALLNSHRAPLGRDHFAAGGAEGEVCGVYVA